MTKFLFAFAMTVPLASFTTAVACVRSPILIVAAFTETAMVLGTRAGAATVTLYVPASPTLVTLRVTVWVPARSPMAIEATFRSLASMAVAGLAPKQ